MSRSNQEIIKKIKEILYDNENLFFIRTEKLKAFFRDIPKKTKPLDDLSPGESFIESLVFSTLLACNKGKNIPLWCLELIQLFFDYGDSISESFFNQNLRPIINGFQDESKYSEVFYLKSGILLKITPFLKDGYIKETEFIDFVFNVSSSMRGLQLLTDLISYKKDVFNKVDSFDLKRSGFEKILTKVRTSNLLVNYDMNLHKLCIFFPEFLNESDKKSFLLFMQIGLDPMVNKSSTIKLTLSHVSYIVKNCNITTSEILAGTTDDYSENFYNKVNQNIDSMDKYFHDHIKEKDLSILDTWGVVKNEVEKEMINVKVSDNNEFNL